MIHQVDKNLKEHGDKLPAADKGEAEAAVNAARSAIEANDADAIKQAGERLSQAAMKIGETVYKAEQAASAGPGPGPGPGAGPGGGSGAGPGASAGPGGKAGGRGHDDDVVDAEFEEIDDKKKKS